MKTTKISFLLIFLGAALFNLAIKASEEGFETSICSYCCVIEIPERPPFLGFEYWSELGVALFVLSLGFVITAFKILFDENHLRDVYHITPTD